MIFLMHKNAKTSTFRCWMKHFWHTWKFFEFPVHRKTSFSLCPENPLVEGSVRPNSALYGGVGHFRRIFMIFFTVSSIDFASLPLIIFGPFSISSQKSLPFFCIQQPFFQI